MTHDFLRFPELTNRQMELYYFQSPHKQLVEPFSARVVKVHDGDTITVSMSERNFDFPIRFDDTAAPELSEEGGHEAQAWLEERLLGTTVDVIINEKRVEKWGRLLAKVFIGGIDIGEEEVRLGFAKSWSQRNDGKVIFKTSESVPKWP